MWIGALGAAATVAAVRSDVHGAAAAGVPVVHAGEAGVVDMDGDGLHDELELVLGTSASRLDTDGDGFSDGEEVARGSNPRRRQDVPTLAGASLAIETYSSGGRVHAQTLVYLPADSDGGERVRFGMELNGRLITLPLSRLRGGETARTLSLSGARGSLTVLDPVFPESWVRRRRGMAMYAVLSDGPTYLAADSATMVVLDGEVFERVTLAPVPALLNNIPAQSSNVPTGGVYRPLSAAGGPPNAASIPGQICAQSTMVTGVVGAVVTQEVVDAACISGWDARCTPGCAGTVGLTIRSIDTAALIGG